MFCFSIRVSVSILQSTNHLLCTIVPFFFLFILFVYIKLITGDAMKLPGKTWVSASELIEYYSDFFFKTVFK